MLLTGQNLSVTLFTTLIGVNFFGSALVLGWRLFTHLEEFLNLSFLAEAIFQINSLSPWVISRSEVRSVLKIAVLQRRAILKLGPKLIWAFFIGGFSFVALYFLRWILIFMLSKFFDNLKSDKEGEVESPTLEETVITNEGEPEESLMRATQRDAWILAAVFIFLSVVSNLAGMPLSFNESLGLSVILTTGSDFSVKEEIPVEEVIVDPKRVPGGLGIFLCIMLLSSLLHNSGGSGITPSIVPQNFPNFKPFEPFDSSKTTLFFTPISDDVSELTDTVEIWDEEYAELLRFECERMWTIHFYDL